ncbi:hypothetical protein MBOT_13570 [Mycobacterium botniense]|uniref:Carboxyltransferase domain-containing protein n=1 Tax=Mycobacterium botniense TaxID=84962 RepID=A0A7I9XW22_9MYCO|nr:hypothetical protein MBOT_13570 [Mycobacterium botniense]
MSVATDLAVADTIFDYGDRALLLQFGTAAEVLTVTAALREAELPGVLDIVPARRTVLVKLDGPRYQGVTRQRLRRSRISPEALGADRRAELVIDVVYDGADLTEVASLAGLTTAQVINAHTATPWRVGFSGCAPGFAYLVGGDPRLKVPPRPERGQRCRPDQLGLPMNSAGSARAGPPAAGS